MSSAQPRVSVIVASRNAASRIRPCLDVMLRQCRAQQAECVVVDSSNDETPALVRRFYPQVPLISGHPKRLAPELWTMGIESTRGELVALTIAQCIPGARWLEALLCAPWDEIAGVGGAIEIQQPASLNDEAIFYLRYSGYMLPQSQHSVDDLPGDNAAYKRSGLETCRDAWQNGFWEPFVHKRLRAAGLKLLFEPKMLMYFRQSAPMSEMLRQRFFHGRFFGAQRAGDYGTGERIKRMLTAPGIPLVLMSRVIQRLRAKRRFTPRFLAALPQLSVYLLSWSAGEFCGYAGLVPEAREHVR